MGRVLRERFTVRLSRALPRSPNVGDYAREASSVREFDIACAIKFSNGTPTFYTVLKC